MVSKCAAPAHRELDRGAAAVEFALVMPLLLLLVFALIDFGRMFNAQIVVTEAAREGARAAGYGQTSTQVNTRVEAATSGLADVTATIVDACPGELARVRVTYPFAFVTPLAEIAAMFGTPPEDAFDLTSTAVVSCSAS